MGALRGTYKTFVPGGTYKTFVDRYPGRCDFTKTYYFKKWERQNRPPPRQQQPQLYVPYLPILTDLHETNERLEIVEEGQQRQEETLQPPAQEETPQSPSQEETPQSPSQEETPQPPSQEETPQSPSQEETPQPPSQEETLQPPSQEETLQPQSNNLFSGMSLDEMDIAAQEIVRALQSDQELMDIVENFDLPDSVWDNELAIPDYVLEGDLEW